MLLTPVLVVPSSRVVASNDVSQEWRVSDRETVLPRLAECPTENSSQREIQFQFVGKSILSLAYCIAPWNQCLGGGASLSIPMPENASTTIVPPGGL